MPPKPAPRPPSRPPASPSTTRPPNPKYFTSPEAGSHADVSHVKLALEAEPGTIRLSVDRETGELRIDPGASAKANPHLALFAKRCGITLANIREHGPTSIAVLDGLADLIRATAAKESGGR